jgi:hypothetical protein
MGAVEEGKGDKESFLTPFYSELPKRVGLSWG